MRCTVTGFSLFIINRFYCHQTVFSIRPHHFNRFSHEEFIPLGDAIKPFFCLFFQISQIGIIFCISITVINLRIFIRFSIEKSGRKLTVGTSHNLFFVPVHILLIQLWTFQIIVYRLTVSSCHCCHIQCCFHSSFNFQTVDSGCKHIIHMLDHTQILGIKNVSTSFIFINRHILPGSGLFYNGIFPTARVGTGTLIRISSCKKITEKTSAGIRNTHRSMNKCFNFQVFRNVSADLPDFFQRQFPRTYNSFCPQSIPEIIRSIIGIIRLCTDMALNLRTFFLCDHKYPRVGNDQSIRLDSSQFTKIFPHAIQIPVMSQNIGGYIHFHIVAVCKLNSLFHVFHRKISRLCPQPKSLSSNINCICTKNNCYF